MDILFVVYLGIGMFIAYLLYGQIRFVKLYAKWSTGLRIIMWVLASILFVFSWFGPTWTETIRNLACALVCAMFGALNEGVSPEGIYANSTKIAWNAVSAYDIQSKPKESDLILLFNTVDKKGRVSNQTVTIRFSKKNEATMKAMVESHIKKKYRRMK